MDIGRRPPARRACPDAVHETTRRCPAPAWTPPPFWSGFDRAWSPPSRRATAPCCTAATPCRRRSTPGTAQPRPAARPRGLLSAFLRDIGYLPPARADSAIADRANVDAEIAQHRRAAAGGAGQQRPLCAERRQCALGQPVRRAVRHRRDRRRRRHGARPRLQPGARRARWWPRRAPSSTRPPRWRTPATPTWSAYAVRDGAAGATLAPAQRPAWPIPASSPATRGDPAAPVGGAAAQPRPAHRAGVRPRPPDRPHRPRRARRCRAGSRRHHHHGLRGLGRRRGCRRTRWRCTATGSA